MQYEQLYANDNGTVKVRMTIDEYVLEQDIDFTDNFDADVKQAMAVFKAELDKSVKEEIQIDTDPVVVTKLPKIKE